MEFKNLLTLIQAVSDSELTGLKYEEKGVKIHLTKQKDTVIATQCSGPAMEFAAGTPAFVSSAAAGESTGAAEDTSADDKVQETEVKAAELGGKIVKSPLVGTFYAAPAEDAKAYVSVGDTVKKGQVLAIVEAMKLMNEIESDYDGTIAEILVENGQGVEYGQPLFRIS